MNERKRTSPPGYISSEEAAARLGVSKDRLYQWVGQGRLTAFYVGNAFTYLESDVANFERQPTGRKRKGPPPWRIYKGEVKVHVTSISVPVQENKQEQLLERIQQMQEAEEQEHVFKGTMARYIIQEDAAGNSIQILLFYKSTEMPVEAERNTHLEVFKKAYADILDWTNAHVKTTEALTYT